MAAPGNQRAVRRPEVRRISSSSGSDPSAHGLPLETLQTAVRRLGILSLLVAVLFPAGYWAERVLQPERVSGPIPLGTAAAVLVIGTAMGAAAWNGRIRPELALDLGLIF